MINSKYHFSSLLKRLRFVSKLSVVLVVVACTDEKPYLPDIAQYKSDSDLMINICNKFANDEGDVKKLRDVALAVQIERVISCTDYNGECDLYNECLSLVIKVTESKNISQGDREKLKDKVVELKKAVEDGKVKLWNNLKTARTN